MITLKDVSLIYEGGENPALKDVNINIDKGEFIFVIGKSGAGKSSLIKLILKEIAPTTGEITVAGYDLNKLKSKQVPFLRRHVGVVFQDYRLLENRTVYENVAFAMEVMQHKQSKIQKRVPNVLRMVGLKDKARKYPNQLSGGEQQRVAIARSIINNPKILICDEPTGNLDPQTSIGIMKLLHDINKRGTTLLVATHDKTIVDAMQRRVIALKDGVVIGDRKGGYGH
ncbi:MULTISPECIES: cell division ATP-binding protein FtsE [Anaerofustis]|uniref:cell division ATP-binding protein FtsE n=1 Tax=Anaerofustis TaxID=264995 RepID=UPI001106E761|nr:MULTISPECIES: cell division ATP-binding protein FtsE [Anaerofustis]MCO8194540.1 cell division ATP-binding protein FtsE [Anaerofustis sp. NSJ-163]